MGLRDRIAAIKAERGGPTQSSAIGVQQAIEAENAAKAARVANALEAGAQVVGASGTIQGKTLEEIALRGSTNQVTYGPVNPPEGHPLLGTSMMPVEQKTREELEKVYPTSPEPLPPAEAPTRPDAPQATRRRGRPPGSKNKVKGPEPEGAVPAHEISTYTPEPVHEILSAAFDATSPDTIPAPSQELLSDDVMAEIAKRVTSRIARALLATINENEEP